MTNTDFPGKFLPLLKLPMHDELVVFLSVIIYTNDSDTVSIHGQYT